MTDKPKSQKPPKGAAGAEKKPAQSLKPGERVFSFVADKMKIPARNYKEALAKRNKMIAAPPSSKDL